MIYTYNGLRVDYHTGSLPVIGVPWWLIYYINWWGLHLDEQYWTGHWGMPLMTGINPVIKGYIYLNERFIIGHPGTNLEDWYWTSHWGFPGWPAQYWSSRFVPRWPIMNRSSRYNPWWLDWYQSSRAYLNECLCGSLRYGTWRVTVLSPPGLRLPPFTLLVSRPVV